MVRTLPLVRHLQTKTAFRRFPPVHRADLEGSKGSICPVRRAFAGCPLFARRGRPEST